MRKTYLNKKILYYTAGIILIVIITYLTPDSALKVLLQSNFTYKNDRYENKNFELIIDKLNIKSPVILDVDPVNKDVYNQELTKGVAHMKGTAMPGDKGNVFIYGHSSSDIKSPYDKIFSNLNNLNNDDKIIINYKNSVYTYRVIEKKIVEKTDLSVIEQKNNSLLTLMTCWPLGTTEKRLIIIAEQS